MNPELEQLARRIDAAVDEGSLAELELLGGECSTKTEQLGRKDAAVCFFLWANCHAGIASSKLQHEGNEWSWNQKAKVAELLCLRKAVSSPGFSELDTILQCKIITNTAGTLSYLGRPVEAIAIWDKAIEEIPNFAMALGNRGIGLVNYGSSLYDYSHSAILNAYALKNLQAALADGALWDSGPQPEVEQYFSDYFDSAAKRLEQIKYDPEFDLNQWSLGETEGETGYRGWCLRERLFLSPLNDICTFSAAAQDVLHLPDHSYKTGEKPRFVGYFNALKQEYTTARHIAFEGIQLHASHYADRDVLLLHAQDGVQLDYRTEQLRIAYRLLYSLLDKVAIFINEYFAVGMAPGKVSFRRIWGITKNGQFELYQKFENSENLPLRGLFYLSKDLFDDKFNDASLPEARDLATLRNFAEHRFVGLGYGPLISECSEVHAFVNIDDFKNKLVRVARIAREALIYLSLAMHREEQHHHEGATGLIGSVQSMPIER